MGSKKKRHASSNKNRRTNSTDAVRKAQPDMSKYAGAVSNKSKRNYADLKLVRPENLTEYASRSSTEGRSSVRTESSGKSASGSSSRSGKQSPAKRKTSSASPKSDSSRPRKPKSTGQKPAQSVKKNTSKAGSKPSSVKKKSSSQKTHGAVKKPRPAQREPVVEYAQDEYSKALNNSDFYSSVIEKYYIKHPEELEKREKTGIPRKKKPPAEASVKSSKVGKRKPKASPDVKPDSKSVAEMAVKSRGSSSKKDRAKVVKGGKARGVVPTRAAHRRVRQRNRRKTAVFNSVIVLATVVGLVALYVGIFFNVKKIEVKGESPYSENQVISMCSFTEGDNILFVDADGSEKKITQKLPYIESCTIKRKLPATVVVNVTEVEILGVAEIAANCWASISTKGKILDTVTNSAVVSSSDVLVSLTYDSEAVSARAVADKKGLPVLEGVDFKNSSVDGYIQGEAAEYLADFEQIYAAGQKLGMKFTCLRYGDKGYEAEYDSRITIVLGDISDKTTLMNNLKAADYILRSGDITEHERGKITYIKNEITYSPSYEQAEEETEQSDRSAESKPAQSNTGSQNDTSSSPPNDTSSDTLNSE